MLQVHIYFHTIVSWVEYCFRLSVSLQPTSVFELKVPWTHLSVRFWWNLVTMMTMLLEFYSYSRARNLESLHLHITSFMKTYWSDFNQICYKYLVWGSESIYSINDRPLGRWGSDVKCKIFIQYLVLSNY